MPTQNLETRQTLAQRPILSQQQLRYVRLLELNAPELDETVERELEENEALVEKEEVHEEDTRRYPLFSRRSSHSEDYEFAPADRTANLYDYLNTQLSERNLSPKVEFAARYLIGNLDSNGYLRGGLHHLIDEMAFREGVEVSEEEGRQALAEVQRLDPAGVGAADLRECLQIQLRAMPASPERDNALRILADAYEAFTMKHRHRIRSLLKLSDAEADNALSLIKSLNPKPGASMGNDPADTAGVIVPDFVVTEEEGEFYVTLNNSVPELQIAKSFEQAMASVDRTPTGRPRKGSEYIVSRYNDARDFIRVLQQRQNTMMTVMSAIIKLQHEYFMTRNVYRLKPMMIKTVADITGLDISVISRATNNKYVSTPWGVFPLRFFFSDEKGDKGESEEATTNRMIEARIRTLVEKEDKRHPLSDQRLMETMNAEGFDLKRRTVAKYRDRLGIPVARLRKEL